MTTVITILIIGSIFGSAICQKTIMFLLSLTFTILGIAMLIAIAG